MLISLLTWVAMLYPHSGVYGSIGYLLNIMIAKSI